MIIPTRRASLSFPTPAAYHAHGKISTKLAPRKVLICTPRPRAGEPVTPRCRRPCLHSGYCRNSSDARSPAAAAPTRKLAVAAHCQHWRLVTLWQVDPRVGRLWLNTAWLAGGACLIALPLGTLLAVAIFKTDVPGRGLAAWLLVGMLFVPLYSGHRRMGRRLRHPRLAHARDQSAPGTSTLARRLAGGGLGSRPGGRAVGRADRRRRPAGRRSRDRRRRGDVRLRRERLCGTSRSAGPRRRSPSPRVWVAIVVMTEISVTDFFQVRTFAEEVYTQSALGTFDVSGVQGAGSGAGARNQTSRSGSRLRRSRLSATACGAACCFRPLSRWP